MKTLSDSKSFSDARSGTRHSLFPLTLWNSLLGSIAFMSHKRLKISTEEQEEARPRKATKINTGLKKLNLVVKDKPHGSVIQMPRRLTGNLIMVISGQPPLAVPNVTPDTLRQEFFKKRDTYGPREKEFLAKLNHLRIYDIIETKNTFFFRTCDMMFDLLDAAGLTGQPFKLMYVSFHFILATRLQLRQLSKEHY
jgi:hypothetical protein